MWSLGTKRAVRWRAVTWRGWEQEEHAQCEEQQANEGAGKASGLRGQYRQ